MLYHSIRIDQHLTKDQVKEKLMTNLPQNWGVSDAVLPGRDIVVSASELSGVFISVKAKDDYTMLNFNVTPPSVLLRGFLLISLFTSKPVVDYVYKTFSS